MKHLRNTAIFLLAACVAGGSGGSDAESGDADSGGPDLEVFSDELVSFPIPAGGRVTRAVGNSYLVF